MLTSFTCSIAKACGELLRVMPPKCLPSHCPVPGRPLLPAAATLQRLKASLPHMLQHRATRHTGTRRLRAPCASWYEPVKDLGLWAACSPAASTAGRRRRAIRQRTGLVLLSQQDGTQRHASLNPATVPGGGSRAKGPGCSHIL